MNEISVGTELPTLEETATLTTSVRYAGASGDLNPLHFDQDFAGQVSPTGGIIAHGMFAMGLASRLVTAFAGGPEAVRSLQARFSRPWPLGTTVTFGGKVTAVEGREATVSLWGQDPSGSRILRGNATIVLQG